MQEDYTGVLLQWLFLFALLSVLLIPAFRFRRIALEHGKKGWYFFPIGLIVGYLIQQIVVLGISPLKNIPAIAAYSNYLFIPLLALCYLGIFFAIHVFRRVISR